jgi:hypothetical protein
VFDVDMEHCPHRGGGQLGFIAPIPERPAIEKVFTHLRLDPQSPPMGRAHEAMHLLPESRPPSETHRHSLQRQTAARAAVRAVSVQHASQIWPVQQVVQRVVTRHLLGQAGLKADEGHGGAVTLIQRLGSAANLNIHLHCLVLHGVYRCDADGALSFVEVDAPTDDELHTLLQSLITRLMKLHTRRGVLPEPASRSFLQSCAMRSW